MTCRVLRTETLPFEGLLKRRGWLSHEERESQETGLAFWCSKDYWPGEELDYLIAALEVRASTSGKIFMEIDLAQKKGTFFYV